MRELSWPVILFLPVHSVPARSRRFPGDRMDISMEAIDEDRAYIVINKELQRVSKEALKALDGKDVLLVFPETRKSNKTVRILKSQKQKAAKEKFSSRELWRLCLSSGRRNRIWKKK